ncbi:MAG TPA: crosslink repair DNA glycosylase YcaQ family protein [Armatimonadota bacterium]
MKFSVAAARALLLTAQGLTGRRRGAMRKADVLAAIQRMGLLQIDTISVVARSPYLVLWSRLGQYEPCWLDELLAEGALFEYWSHAACFLPIEDFPLYRRRMLEHAAWVLPEHGEQTEQRTQMQAMLAHIREEGAVRSADFTHEGRKSNGWWDWKPEKRTLEQLFNAGHLMIARREGFQRIYDLRERVLPAWDDRDTPSLEHVRRELILKAVRTLGVATAAWVGAYFPEYLRRHKPCVLLETLVEEGALLRAQIVDWPAPVYVHPANLSLAERAAAGALRPRGITLLSPFDPVVSDRARTRSLFGFDYSIETYTPAEKRKYGYFSLPILRNGELIGRLDPKAHRKIGVFEVRALHLEPGVRVTDRLLHDLAGVLRDCAHWHQTPDVVVRAIDPPEISPRLQHILSSQ